MSGQADQPYRLRKATDQDREFLYGLHVAALKEYVEATWGWDETWQYNYFNNNFDPGKYHVVVVDGKDIGVVSLEESKDQLHLALVEIMPAYQGQGIGSALIREYVRLAHEQGRAFTLEVLRVNLRARKFYERLGLKVSGQDKYKFDMSYPP